MNEAVSIGIIGDYESERPAHKAVVAALSHAAEYLSIKLDVCWLPTEPMLEPEYQKGLEQYSGIWASPGSPYQSMDGALSGIRFAREMNRSFLGT